MPNQTILEFQLNSEARQATWHDAPEEIMDLPDSTSPTPTPMALVRRLIGTRDTAGRTVIYFDSTRGVYGPGFRNDIQELMTDLVEVKRTLAEGAGDHDYFISMVPSRFLHFDPPHGPTVTNYAEVPDFQTFFAPICRIIQEQISVPCDVELDVEMEGRWRYSYKPRLVLRIIKRESRGSVCARDLGIELDPSNEVCQSLFTWFAGCEGGIVVWKPSIRPDAASQLALEAEAVHE
jgi:hypothetical protein